MPEIMQREIRKAIGAHAAPRTFKALKVVVAKLGDHAGTIGAAQLAVDMQYDDPPLDLG